MSIATPRSDSRRPLIVFLLLVAQLVPALPQYIGVASSMALGEVIAAAMILVSCSTADLLNRRAIFHWDCQVNLSGIGVSLVVAAIFVAHVTVADQFIPVDFGRFTASLIPLVLTIVAGMAFARALASASSTAVDQAIRISFGVLYFLVLLRIVNFEPRGSYYVKPIFPFTETSHFALAFAPILMYVCSAADGARKSMWLAVGFATAVLLQSVALLAACFLVAVVIRRFLVIAVPVVIAVAFFLPLLNLQYFVERLDFSGTGLNLSNLVYVQGWQQLSEALVSSSGWGLGFEQLGVHDAQVAATELIRAVTGGIDHDLQSGSFVLSKFGSEFGIFGLVLVFAYLVFAAHCVRALRRGRMQPAVRFARCVVVAYGVDMFFRGTGYFSQSTFLFLVALVFHFTHGAKFSKWWQGLFYRTGIEAGVRRDLCGSPAELRRYN